jgi:hypothetical protein
MITIASELPVVNFDGGVPVRCQPRAGCVRVRCPERQAVPSQAPLSSESSGAPAGVTSLPAKKDKKTVAAAVAMELAGFVWAEMTA